MENGTLIPLEDLSRAILSENMESHAVLRIILDKARELTRATQAHLYRVSGRHLQLEISAPPRSDHQARPPRVDIQNTPCGLAVTTNQYLIVRDRRLHPELYKASSHTDFISELVAPIRSEEATSPTGALSLTSQTPDHFTKEHAAIAKTLADQAAVAIAHLDLLNRLYELRKLDSAILSDEATLNSVTSVVLSSVKRLTAAEEGQILLLDAGREILRVIASDGAEINQELTLDSVCGEALLTHSPILIDNWTASEKYKSKYRPLPVEARSELAVPLELPELSIVLNVESPRESAFGIHDRQILEDFGR